VTTPAAWRPRDCHAHTTWSDGQLTPAELVARAAALDVLPSITDHVSCAVAAGPRTVEALGRYLDELEALPVARGAEFCWHDSLWRELPDSIVCRFTHRVGSLHAVYLEDGTLVHAFQRKLPTGLEPQAYMDAHVAGVERLAREMPVDVFAHPTLLPLPFRRIPLEELWTEAREERAVEALYRAGTAFEVSARYRPHERFVRRAAERGVRLSLGSDGHTPEQVANVFPSLALTRALGVPDEELYDPLVHGSKVEQRARRASA
jgi:histidinol phosphatase-like PHP family hydrolase